MTGDAGRSTDHLRAATVAAGMHAPGFDALADALCDAMPHIGFDAPQIEACALVALDLHRAERHIARRAPAIGTPSIDALAFDDGPHLSPDRRIHARQYNAALAALWREHLAVGGDVTDDAMIRVASDALAITNARLARI